ncbi:MAG: hypothetical protein JNM93_07000 [Bacteriovoracaceae bacterium]|nr:hypothetical protein [Bacteriovoracaceae bacterium]
MEETYKTHLNALQKKVSSTHFSDDLFGAVNWSFVKSKPSEAAPVKPVEPSLLSEKHRVLRSFHEFSEQKIEAEGQLSVAGGEIIFKKPTPKNYLDAGPQNIKVHSHSSLKALATQLLGKRADLKYEQELTKSVKVYFITDKYLAESAVKESNQNSKLATVFQNEVFDLFSKMVKAMQLTEADYQVGAMQIDEKEEVDFLYQEILYHAPQFVIPLGATATRMILDLSERLSNIHGQFFTKTFNKQSFNEFTFSICPLFHPEFLLINPNMKKTVWIDMQKVMKELK